LRTIIDIIKSIKDVISKNQFTKKKPMNKESCQQIIDLNG